MVFDPVSGSAAAEPAAEPGEVAVTETPEGTVVDNGLVRIRVDAFSEHDVTGTVDSIAPASGSVFSLLPPENATGNFTKIVQRVPVRIAVPPNGPLAMRLRPGLSVEVSVDTRAEGAAPAEGAIVGAAEAKPAGR